MYFDNWKDQWASNNSDESLEKNGSDSLVSFFSETNKDDLSRMAGDVSDEAKDFFDNSIHGLLGQLPEEMADTTMTMSKSALQQLLFSSMVTGYVAKSVENKLSLEKLLNGPKKNSKNTLEDKLNTKPPFQDNN